MAQSNRLRLSEVRQALRLVGECRDLGSDARAWFTHAMCGLQTLLQSNVVIGTVGRVEAFRLHSQFHLVLGVGWESPRLEQAAMTYQAQEMHLRDPAFRRFREIARPYTTLRPLRLISRRVFETSGYHAARKGFGVEDFLFSQRKSADRRASFSLSPQRPPHDSYFTARDTSLLRLFHDELALLVGNVLSDGLDDPLANLSPRLRQTLAFLLSGDSEKEVALRMGISRHTVHEYVVALYKRCQVNSRAELMAFCRQRSIGGPARDSADGVGGAGERC